MTEHDTWVPAWDGAAYAANTAHHRAHDADFLASTPLRPTDRVLDLGCGSGDLTAAVADLVPDGHVVGVDAQPSMLDQARRTARPNQSFVEAAVQQLGTALPSPEHDGTFDVVLSRAVLHWVPFAAWPGVLVSIARLVRPGGSVRIECGGAGNVARARALLDPLSAALGGPTSPWNFLDAGQALELLEGAALEPEFVRTVGQRRRFDETTVRGWLRSQILNAYEDGIPAEHHGAFRAAADARLDELRRPDGTFDQTYVRLDLLARRPE